MLPGLFNQLVTRQGGADMAQLKKLAQGYQAQDGGPQLGDIDEDDEVPGECSVSASLTDERV